MAGALTRFRVMAWIVGVLLLALTAGMILKYGFGNPHLVEMIGPLHGFLYVIYLITTIDLAVKAKFSVVRTVLVMLAGTIPFLSFVAEHNVTRDVREQMTHAPAEVVPSTSGR